MYTHVGRVFIWLAGGIPLNCAAHIIRGFAINARILSFDHSSVLTTVINYRRSPPSGKLFTLCVSVEVDMGRLFVFCLFYM